MRVLATCVAFPQRVKRTWRALVMEDGSLRIEVEDCVYSGSIPPSVAPRLAVIIRVAKGGIKGLPTDARRTTPDTLR